MADSEPSRSNWDALHTRFVGRDDELSQLRQLCNQPGLSLVSGPAGVGKSRLALEAVSHWLATNEAAVAFRVELGAARDLPSVLRRIGRALGMSFGPAETAQAVIERTGDALHDRGEVALLLDDAEHVCSWLARPLAQWRQQAPRARIIVTSRRDLPAEPIHTRLALAALSQDAALELLIESARRVRPDFSLGDSQQAAARALLRHLDALPLAIEVVAPRLRLLSPSQLLARFGDTGDPRSALLQALARSWELLSPWERDALAQTAVFRDGFYMNAAEALIDLGIHPDAPDVLTVLEGLVAQSLLRTTTLPELPDEVRIMHFVSVQEFSLSKLSQPQAVQARHRDYFMREGERWDAGIESESEIEHTHRLIVELPNLEAAFEGADDAPESLARLGLVLHMAYQRRGPFDDQAALCSRVIAAATACGNDTLQARGLLARARVARWSRDDRAALADLSFAHELAVAAGDVVTEASCCRNQAACHFAAGDLQAAELALQCAREAGERSGRDCDRINAHNGLSHLWAQRGDFERAQQELEQALSLARRAGIPGLRALLNSSLSELMVQQRRLPEAEHYSDQAIAQYQALHYVRQLCLEHLRRGRVRLLGDLPGAEQDACAALHMASSLGLRALVARALLLDGQRLFFARDFGAAHERWARALRDTPRSERAPLLLYDAAACAVLGQQQAAQERLRDVGQPTGELAEALLRAFVSQDAGETSAELARRALADGDPEPARLGALLLGERFASDAAQPERATVVLELSGDARRYRVRPNPPVDLTRRRALRGILHCLAEQHQREPGQPLQLEQVLAAGWPGELMSGDSGARRVYVTMNRLRNSGLGELVLTMGDGYMLAPHVEILRS